MVVYGDIMGKQSINEDINANSMGLKRGHDGIYSQPCIDLGVWKTGTQQERQLQCGENAG